MRLKGKLINWDDKKAFGFIAPNGGGDHVFIHKTAFSNKHRTPQINDVITFSVSRDKQGRHCAADATFSGEKLRVRQPQSVNKFSIYLSIAFMSVIVIASILNKIPPNVLYLYAGLSVIAILMYALDKSKAKKGAWRIAESTLHLFSLAGGWPGAAIAQQTLRHKSKKREFRFMFWLTVIVNCCALAWLISPYSAQMIAVFS